MMKIKNKKKYLRRYTSLFSLLDILENKRITFLNPENWDDKNDYYFINKYRDKSNYKSVLVLCFTERGERYHHWKVFTEGSSGVCIVFKRDELIKQLSYDENIIYGSVKYKKIKELENDINIEEIPFIKRIQFKDEKEFRIIYKAKYEDIKYKHFNIDYECIEKIVLNPWLPDKLIQTLRKIIKKIGDKSIKVHKTTLINNEKWKSTLDKADFMNSQ